LENKGRGGRGAGIYVKGGEVGNEREKDE